MKDFSQKAKYMLCQISGKISIDIGGTYGTVKITCMNIFKPGTPGFLKLILCESFVCMFVCVSTPEAINNQWRDVA